MWDFGRGPEFDSRPNATGPRSGPARPARTDFKGGRYIVKGFLGAGASKTVYLVHDTILDRDVALALISAEGLDEVERARISREAQTLARLGDHRNIVPIYDIGEEDGQPFMVMPVMSGEAVQGLVRGDGEERPDLSIPCSASPPTSAGAWSSRIPISDAHVDA